MAEVNAGQQRRRHLSTIYDVTARRSDKVRSSQNHSAFSKEVVAKPLESTEILPGTPKDTTSNSKLLPDSDLLKDIHTYASDFYAAVQHGEHDFKSLDETALLAIGILLEESCKEALHDTGDMVFTEPQERDLTLPLNRTAQYQIIGRVVPQPVQEYQAQAESDEEFHEEKPRKRQRRRYGDAE